MKKLLWWSVVCLIILLGNICPLHADTEIDGTATTSSSFTFSGPVSISTLTVNGIVAANLNMNANKITSLADGTNSSDAVAFDQVSGYRVLQTQYCYGTTRTSTTSSSYVPTVITCSITPSSTSSKIRIYATSTFTDPNTGVAAVTLERGSTDLASGTYGFFDNNSGTQEMPFTIVYTDSPGTTSSVTYTVYAKVAGGTVMWVNQNQPTWTMTLDEIN